MMNAEIGHKFEPAVGALLRASRLRCGEELRDVAALLRIRQAYLEAIEEGRYEDLPGITYAVGFVRTYAEHLGLDSEEVVRRFKAESENLERRTELVFPSPIAERGTPGAAIIFIGVLVAALAYGAWYIGTSEESVFDELVTPLPDRLAALLPGDTGQPAQTDQGPSTAEAAPQPGPVGAAGRFPPRWDPWEARRRSRSMPPTMRNQRLSLLRRRQRSPKPVRYRHRPSRKHRLLKPIRGPCRLPSNRLRRR